MSGWFLSYSLLNRKKARLTAAWLLDSLLAHLVPTSLKGTWELRKENQRQTWGKEPGFVCTACHSLLPIEREEIHTHILWWLCKKFNWSRLIFVRQWPWLCSLFYLSEQPRHRDRPMSGCGPLGRCAMTVLHSTLQEQEPDPAVHSERGRWTLASGPPKDMQKGLYSNFPRINYVRQFHQIMKFACFSNIRTHYSCF